MTLGVNLTETGENDGGDEEEKFRKKFLVSNFISDENRLHHFFNLKTAGGYTPL
jgi:hypothetical protein